MRARTGQPGVASLALAVILVVTAAWWTLALWPAGVATPEWVLRTQDACFGSARTGRPDAGGWILLIGEPLGMLVALIMIAGASLQDELGGVFSALAGTPSGRRAVLAIGGLVALGLAPAIVTRATAAPAVDVGGVGRPPTEVQRPAPSTALVDQYGNPVSLRSLYRPAILTVAFAHCETVCPTLVREVQRARERAGRETMPLFIVTVDPWRDTAERLPTIARQWNLGPDDHVLTGEIGAVEKTLDALAVGRARDPDTGNVAHATVVLLLDEHGRITSRFDGDLGQLAMRLARAN